MTTLTKDDSEELSRRLSIQDYLGPVNGATYAARVKPACASALSPRALRGWTSSTRLDAPRPWSAHVAVRGSRADPRALGVVRARGLAPPVASHGRLADRPRRALTRRTGRGRAVPDHGIAQTYGARRWKLG